MRTTLARVAILALVIVSITVVFFIGFKLNIAPHVQSEMDRWVGIATVCTAISSAIVGLISVWVMFDQKKTQDKLMSMQVSEHQPIFKVKIEEHASLDQDQNPFDYEEVKISNIGNNSFILKEWDTNGYAYFKFKLNNNVEDFLIKFPDYFGTKSDKINSEDILISTRNSQKHKNLDILNKANQKLLGITASLECPSIYVERLIYTFIRYIDLYGNEQTRYFINTLPVDKAEFERIPKNAKYKEECFLEDFDILEYTKYIPPRKSPKLIINQ